jgi:hypothetical protein
VAGTGRFSLKALSVGRRALTSFLIGMVFALGPLAVRMSIDRAAPPAGSAGADRVERAAKR